MRKPIQSPSKPKKRPAQSDTAIYRPLKRPVYLMLDADVLLWLKGLGGPYTSRINRMLRDAMNETRAGRRAQAMGVTE
jgi:uncharacterized protein (DUF4415 family)